MHVLIVDDHAFVCVGLKATLHDEYQNIDVTTTDHGDTALVILARKISIWLLSICLCRALAAVLTLSPCSVRAIRTFPIIVLSASENPAHIRKCLDYGAAGFVTKSAPKDALFEAISRALKGEKYVP